MAKKQKSNSGKQQNTNSGNKNRSSNSKVQPKQARTQAHHGASNASPINTQQQKPQKPASAPPSTRANAARNTTPVKQTPSGKPASPARQQAAKPVKELHEPVELAVEAKELQEVVDAQETLTAAELSLPLPVAAVGIPEAEGSIAGISIYADVKEVEPEVSPFEPDLDPTPVKPRDTRNRSLLSLEAELDALLSELKAETEQSEFEETLKRPAIRLPRETDAQTVSAAQSAVDREIEPGAEASPSEPVLDPTLQPLDTLPLPGTPAQEFYGMPTLIEPVPLTYVSEISIERVEPVIPETPLPPASELTDIPETPLPPASEEDVLTEIALLLGEEQPVDNAEANEAGAVAVITETATRQVTPWQWPELETLQPASEVKQKRPLIAGRAWLRPLLQRRAVKRATMLLSLFLLLTSSLLLWQNVNATQLYLYHIDPGSGQTLAQQDLGVYQDITSLSAPTLDSSSLLLGISTMQSAQQQVLSLSGAGTAWNVTRRFAAPPGRFTLSAAPGSLLALESSGGLQVVTGAGRVLWQALADAPALGAHAFAPAIDNTTVYTVKSARQGMVAAYDLHSGALRWTQQLDDTLNYAPPLLLAGDTLYVAGDHTIFALNRVSGILLWAAAAPARTLLFEQGSQPTLIAAGASGLRAFDAQSGALAWSLTGQPHLASTNSDTLTAAQFYQAGIASTNNMLYATGIVWDVQQARQQLWLFAVDVSSGKVRWTERIGAGFSSADAGRVFAPFVDASQGLVLLEQAQADGSHTLSAFNTADGSLRWSTRFAAVSASAPALIQVASNTLSIFSAQTDAATALRSMSWTRLLLCILAFVSLLALVLLWILPVKVWRKRVASYRLRSLARSLRAPARGIVSLWRFSRLLFALTFVAASICAAILAYTQLSRQQPYVKQVEASSGKALWQRSLPYPATLAGADTQGGLLVTGAGDQTYQLSALTSASAPRWSIPSGEATFSFPGVATRPGTVLAALNGPASLAYRYAPDDPAYQNPLAHYFALDLLDSNTGLVLWQSDVVNAGASQDAVVLGADTQFIYVASRSLQGNSVAQLSAIDKASGSIAWRVFGPREQGVPDYGALLTHGRFVYWQVNDVVYALDTQSGQIQWRTPVGEGIAAIVAPEEAQMAIGNGVLLLRRSDMYHALDLLNGAERWTLSGLGTDNAGAPGGIVATGSEFVLYGGGVIEAYNAATQSVLWKHDNLGGVSNVTISQDGSLVYAVIFNTLDGAIGEQSLVAFDVKINLIHWTFQPYTTAQLIYTGSNAIYGAQGMHGMLFVTTCQPGSSGNCNHQNLYALDGNTGSVRWTLQARQFSNAQLSQDGETLTFQTYSSAWENLKAML